MTDDNGPKIVISLWVMTAVSFVFMNLRFYCKGVYVRQLRIDDAVLLLSWCFATVYCALITICVNYGFGKRKVEIDTANIVPAYKYLFLGEFFTIISIPTSKTSFAITLLRITTRKWQKWFVWFVIVTVNIFYWLCAIFLLAQCQPIEKNWETERKGHCWHSSVQDNFAVFVGAYSALLDIILSTFPCLIIRALQMSKKEKLGLIIAMSLGVLSGLTAALKIPYLPGLRKFPDPTHDLADLLIWSNAETTVTIMAASIPFFRVLLRGAAAGRQSYRLGSVGPGGGKVGDKGVGGILGRGGEGDDGLSERERGILGEGGIVKCEEVEVVVRYDCRGERF